MRWKEFFIQSKWQSWGGNTHIRQDFTKQINKQRRALYNDKGAIEKEHIFVNIRASKYVKQILTNDEEESAKSTMIAAEDLITHYLVDDHQTGQILTLTTEGTGDLIGLLILPMMKQPILE